MLIQMRPAVLELPADEPNPVEVGAHSKPLIFFLDFPVVGAFLCQGLMIERKAKNLYSQEDNPVVK